MVKKIAILTSGGDAPGMNAAVVGAIRAGYNLNKEMYVVMDGYKGLVEGNFKKVEKDFGAEFTSFAGTIIKSARLPEFKQEEVQNKAVAQLKKEGIDAMIIIGGDGSFMGAKKLTEKGINCIGLPATIDNDISSTDITIGFDSSLNNVVESIDEIKTTSLSHHRSCIIEIMGNKCADLTLYAGIATQPDIIITPDFPYDEDEVVRKVKDIHDKKNDSVCILLSEKFIDGNSLFNRLANEVGLDIRYTILGHTQRGAHPSAMERFNAIRMGSFAVELLNKDIGGVCIGFSDNKLVYRDIMEALAMKRTVKKDLYDTFELIK